MSRGSLILGSVVIALALLVLGTMGTETMQGLQAGFLRVLSPFLRTGSAVQEQFGEVGKGLKTLDQLEEENRRLIVENRELRATNQLLRDAEIENNKLREALDYRKNSVFKLVAARVISRDASTWWNTIKINRGFEDGIESDQPVLTDVGLVGKTTTVAKNETIVVLVTDETCKVACKVEGTLQHGILSGLRLPDGESGGEMQLNYLSKAADLQPGQKVYTVGVRRGSATGVFPSGILVGEVVGFQPRALDGQAIVRPAVDLSTIEDVFVVVGAK